MSCGTGECGCGCEEFVELKPRKSLPVIEETRECGDGSCGCGCMDIVQEEKNNTRARVPLTLTNG